MCGLAGVILGKKRRRAEDVIGTHNGTIYNADYLFRRFKVRRFAEVDSELLFRLAEERCWRELSVPPMSMIVFRHEVLTEFSRESLEFIVQEKRGKAP